MRLGLADQIDVPADEEAWPIPGYRLIRRLGVGGFGEVWEAEGPGGFRVALKFVGRSEGREDAELRALEILKQIRHPNLLVTFGSWHVDRHLVIGMELADRTLWDRFRESVADGLAGIPRTDLLSYIGQAAGALDYLNSHRHALNGGPAVGVQHRDVKPENILLIGGGAKVADFGLARLLTNSVASHTGRWTATYAAPEFFRRETSDRSDQYSLAVTYCHLRCGRPPFQGSPASVIAGHILYKPDLDLLPAEERPILARALAKDPKDRWADCVEFVRELGGVAVAEETLLPPEGSPSEMERPAYRSDESDDSVALAGAPFGSSVDTIEFDLGRWLPGSDPDGRSGFSGTAAFEFGAYPEPSSPEQTAQPGPSSADPGRSPEGADSAAAHRPDDDGTARPRAAAVKRRARGRVGVLAAVGLALIAGLGLPGGVRWPHVRSAQVAPPGGGPSTDAAVTRDADRGLLAWNGRHLEADRTPGRLTELDILECDGSPGGPIDAPPRRDDAVLAPPRPAGKPKLAAAGQDRRPDGGNAGPELVPPAGGEAPSPPPTDRAPEPAPTDRAVARTSDRPGAAVPALASPTALRIDVSKGVTIPVGGHDRLTVKVDREGNAGQPVTIRFDGVPSGVELRETTVPEGRAEVDVEVTAGPSASPGRWPVEVVGTIGTSRASAPWVVTVERPDAAEPSRRGYALLAGRDSKGALEAFGEAVRLDPKHAASYRGRGQAHYLLGRDAEALADLDEAIRLDPADALALNNRGLVRLRRGELDRATADFDEAIRHRPDVASYRCNRGSAYRLRGDTERAVADYTRAIELNRSYVEAYDGRSVVMIAARRYDKALADCDAALRLNPDDAAAHNSRGLALCQLGKVAEAIASYDAAARLRPNDGVVRYNRGLAHAQAGNLDAAVADYDAAIGLSPKLDGPQQARRVAMMRRARRPLPDPGAAGKVGALRPR